MYVKKEVKELCIKLRNAEKGSKEFENTQKILQRKYGFTPFSLLALFYKEPFIEYETEQIPLIMEE